MSIVGNTKMQAILGFGICAALMSQIACAGVGKIVKLELRPSKDRTMLVVTHQGDGKFRLFQSQKLHTLILEGDNFTIPANLTKTLDAGSSGGPVLQLTPYNSENGGHPMSKLVVQLRGVTDVSSTELPGKFIVEIKKQAWEKAAANPTAKDILKGRASAPEDSEASDSNASSEVVAKKLIDVLSRAPDDKVYFGSKVTYVGNDVAVPDIFRLMGDASGLNFIWDADVATQTTSISVKDVPWDHLLDLVTQQRSLKAVASGNVVRIMSLVTYNNQMEARNREKALNNHAEPVIMAVVPLSFTDAAVMRTMIQSLLGGAGAPAPVAGVVPDNGEGFTKGKIETDSRTNSLVVTDTRDIIERVRRLVKELDIAVPQILIDSKIIIASEEFSKSVGVRWQQHIRSESGAAGVAGGFNGGTDVLGGGSNAADATSTFSIAGSNNPVGAAIGFGFGASERANVKAALEMAELNDFVKTVASPRVIVVNNKTATISDGQSITQLVPGSGASDAGKSTTTASLSLTVTPQVTSRGSVQLKSLNITKSALSGATATTANTTNKSLTTDVLVDSGGTLVLGGIFQLSQSKGAAGIPLLKDLPFIGQLFRVNNEQNRKDELMVFITPQIVDAESSGQTL